MTIPAQPRHGTERRKPSFVDLRPLYTAAERRAIAQLLGLEERARQYVAFTIPPQNDR